MKTATVFSNADQRAPLLYAAVGLQTASFSMLFFLFDK